MYDNQGSDLYNNIFLYHSSLCIAPALLFPLSLCVFVCVRVYFLLYMFCWFRHAKDTSQIFQFGGRENIKYIYSFAHVIYADYLNFLFANLWHITPELRIMLFSLFSYPLMLYCCWRLGSMCVHLASQRKKNWWKISATYPQLNNSLWQHGMYRWMLHAARLTLNTKRTHCEMSSLYSHGTNSLRQND